MVRPHADGGSGNYTDEIISSLGGDFSKLLSGLTETQINFFGGNDYLGVLRDIASGKFTLDFSNLFTLIFSAIGASITDLLTLLIVVVSIAIIYSILGAFKGRASSESVGKMVHFASVSAMVAVLGATTVGLFGACAETLNIISSQINLIMPIMLTLMAAIGATSSSGVFQPAIAVLTSGLTTLLITVLFPMLIASFVFNVIGNISSEMRLSKVSEFLGSAVKWLFGTGFFILTAFLSVQGITASVFDGISVRSAKFTIGKFVPVIGGYLAEGVNLIISGGIAVKNALGYTALVLLAITVIPIIIKIAVYSLCLRLAAAVVEPLGDKLMSNMLSGMAKTVSLTGAIMSGAAFLYFIFLLIVVSAGNRI